MITDDIFNGIALRAKSLARSDCDDYKLANRKVVGVRSVDLSFVVCVFWSTKAG